MRDFGTVTIAPNSSKIRFDICCDYFQLDHQLFIGLLQEATVQSPADGIGVLIDPENGEVLDLINGEGVIGYFDGAPLESWKQPQISIEMERIGSVYIPEIIVGEERILHPAIHKTEVSRLLAVAGSSPCYLGSHARFLAPAVSVS